MTPNFEPLTTKAAREAFLDEKTSPLDGGASPAGHHYIQEYNQNKWSFYLRYVRGLESKFRKPALLFGGVIHDAKEAFYRSEGDMDFTVDAFKKILDAKKSLYEDPATHTKDLNDGVKMLLHWGATYGASDFENYELLEIEGKHSFELVNGMRASVRWDLLARDRRTSKYYLFDTKTTRYSISKSYQSVEGQDQATMYALGLSRVYPEIFESYVGLVPDIMYKRQSVVSSERPGIVLREKREIVEYEQEIIGLHIELSQKIKALKEGFPWPHMLFPRNGKDDSFFGSDWPDIYRAALPKDLAKAPVGYTVNQEIIEHGPLAELADIEISYEDFKRSPQEGDTHEK